MTDSVSQTLEIMDNIGTTSCYQMHPHRKILAYESGNSILLWDLDSDRKIKMHQHDYQVQTLFFAGKDYKYIVSLDCWFRASIFISDWQQLRRVKQMKLPSSKSKKKPLKNVLGYFFSKLNAIFIVENEILGGHRIQVWEFKNENLSNTFQADIDNQATCLSLETFDNNKFFQIATIEQSMIKFWKYDQDNLSLINRIHVKEDILCGSVNQINNILFFITKTGMLFLINQQGDFISKHKSGSLYTSVAHHDNLLFMGMQNGQVTIFEASSMKQLGNLPYLKINKKRQQVQESNTNYQNNNKNINILTQYQSNIGINNQQAAVPSVVNLQTSFDGHILSIKYSNGILLLYDKLKDQIMHFLIGHFGKINQIEWDKCNRKKFFSCSNDCSLCLWNSTAERWEPVFLDLSKALDQRLANYNSQHISQTFDGKNIQIQGQPNIKKILTIKCLCLNDFKDEIYCGDNKGYLYIFDKFGNFISKQHLSQSKIKSICLSPGCKYIGVSFNTGLALLLDCTNNFSQALQLENHFQENSQTYQKFKGIKLIIDQNQPTIKKEKFVKTDTSIVTQGASSLTKQPVTKFYFPVNDNSFYSFTIHSSNTVRFQLISKVNNILNGFVIAHYTIESKIVGFEIHPSNDYILILSNIGYVYIYKIKSAELRGRIDVPKFSKSLIIDPSGLYFAIACYSKAFDDYDENLNLHSNTVNITDFLKNDKLSDITSQTGNKEIELFFEKRPQIKQNSVYMYEVGTGKQVGKIENLFEIQCLSFSIDGRHLAIGGTKGIMSMWSIQGDVRENIMDVLNQIKGKPDFWQDFPIYLPNPQSEINQIKDVLPNQDQLTESVIEENLPQRIENQDQLEPKLSSSSSKQRVLENENYSFPKPVQPIKPQFKLELVDKASSHQEQGKSTKSIESDSNFARFYRQKQPESDSMKNIFVVKNDDKTSSNNNENFGNLQNNNNELQFNYKNQSKPIRKPSWEVDSEKQEDQQPSFLKDSVSQNFQKLQKGEANKINNQYNIQNQLLQRQQSESSKLNDNPYSNPDRLVPLMKIVKPINKPQTVPAIRSNNQAIDIDEDVYQKDSESHKQLQKPIYPQYTKKFYNADDFPEKDHIE